MDMGLMMPHDWTTLLLFLRQQKGLDIKQTDVIKLMSYQDISGEQNVRIMYARTEQTASRIPVTTHSTVSFIESEYQNWVLNEAFNTTGGAVTTYQSGNGLARPGSFIEALGRTRNAPGSPVKDRPIIPAKQRSLIATRQGYTSDFVKVIKSQSDNLLFRGARAAFGADLPGLACKCSKGQDPTCDHREFAILTGWDRGLLLDTYKNNDVFSVAVPIAMGLINLPFEMEWERNSQGKPTGVISARCNILMELGARLSSFPGEVSAVRLGEYDGTLKLIRFVEGLIYATEPYRLMARAKENAGVGVVGELCRRNHQGTITPKIIAGMTSTNSMRDAWIMASAFTLVTKSLCLPCYSISGGTTLNGL